MRKCICKQDLFERGFKTLGKDLGTGLSYGNPVTFIRYRTIPQKCYAIKQRNKLIIQWNECIDIKKQTQAKISVKFTFIQMQLCAQLCILLSFKNFVIYNIIFTRDNKQIH